MTMRSMLQFDSNAFQCKLQDFGGPRSQLSRVRKSSEGFGSHTSHAQCRKVLGCRESSQAHFNHLRRSEACSWTVLESIRRA